jgi:hypothetical protein
MKRLPKFALHRFVTLRPALQHPTLGIEICSQCAPKILDERAYEGARNYAPVPQPLHFLGKTENVPQHRIGA